MMTMTVKQVESDVRVECMNKTGIQLAEELKAMGVETAGMSREQLVNKLVDLEVYAFTH